MTSRLASNFNTRETFLTNCYFDNTKNHPQNINKRILPGLLRKKLTRLCRKHVQTCNFSYEIAKSWYVSMIKTCIFLEACKSKEC